MISIVIPTLNEEKYLPFLLESIKRQTFSNYEIIVSDAKSQDKTISIAHDFQVKTVVYDKIKHPSAQRNEGAKLAEGDIILFLDADVVLFERDFLEKAYQDFVRRDLGIASFYIKFNPNKFIYRFYAMVANLTFTLKQYGRGPASIGAGIMVKRSIHQQINGFDCKILLSEDCDYSTRASRVSKFRMIKELKLAYSARRIEKEGYLKSGWRWLKMGLFTICNKRIRKKIVKYDFGKF